VNESLNAYIAPVILKNEVKEKNKGSDDQQSNLIFMVITGIYFMMISFATTVANEVVYEKATKTLELILTSVSAKVHFISKMIVGWLVVFVQCLSVGAYILIWL
ncbi:MAG: ABC transporter permease, partial [Longicatena sp.]